MLFLFFALAICLGGTPKLTKVTFKSKLTNKKNDFNFVYKKNHFLSLKSRKHEVINSKKCQELLYNNLFIFLTGLIFFQALWVPGNDWYSSVSLLGSLDFDDLRR